MEKTSRGVIAAFHKYTPFGGEYYESLLEYFLKNMKTYRKEFDQLYILDSTWDIKDVPEWVKVIKVPTHLRYYDAYKWVLPHIEEDYLLFMDNDMVVYKPKVIDSIFTLLEKGWKVCSIFDTIGKVFKELGDKSKFCPYLFGVHKKTLMKYRDVEWGPLMPEYETLGKLTERMLKDKVVPYELEEDKMSIYLGVNGETIQQEEGGKNLGYYHVRAGSTPAYLLATKHYGNKATYEAYLENQPHGELLRQCAWYTIMGGEPKEIYEDLGRTEEMWEFYMKIFKEYHGLQ